jgi:hypothetical protein
VVWRGVPAAVDRSGFWWRAPDGSTVRAEYLPQGYGNGAVLHRYAEATRIAEGLTVRAVDALGATLAGRGPVVVNPSARDRGGLVELVLDGDAELPGTQTLNVRPSEMVLMEFASPSLAAGIVAELDYAPRFHSAAIEATDDDSVLFRAERRAGGGSLISPDDRKRLQVVLEDTAPRQVRVRVTQDPGRKVLTHVDHVPGFGWKGWDAPTVGLGVHPVVAGADGSSLDNGVVSVAVAADGTWSIDDRPGFGRLVHGGDVGDTYNWCPPDDDVEIDAPVDVQVTVLERGPLRGRLQVTSTYRWPSRAGGELVDVVVTTTLELRAGERIVRVDIAWDNRCRDQRVRAVFPLPSPARSSRAECAFAVIERGLTAEGGPTELGLPTFPSRRFVQAGGLTVAHEGLPEYELVDIDDGTARSIAITLARCTGMLSQGPMATRPMPAGPFTPMEGPQLQRPIAVRCALVVGEDVDPYAVVEDAFVPLLVTRASGGTVAADGQALAVHGAEVSALRRTPAGALEVRVFNPTRDTATVTIEGRAGWLVDLRGRPIEAFAEHFDLAPAQLATAILS